MPILPSYNSNRNINAEKAAPFREEAAQPFQDQQKVLGTLQNITQKWSDANDVMQYTEAKAKYEIATADIQARAVVDPDYKNSESYLKELKEVKKNSLSGISNQMVARKAALEFDYGSGIEEIKLGSIFAKKQLEHNQFVLDEGLDALAKKKIMASTSIEAAEIDNSISSLIEANIAGGTISEAEGKKKKEQIEKSSVQYAINVDPYAAEKMITSGQFQSLSPDDRVNFLKVIESAKSQREAEIKREQAAQKKLIEDSLQDKYFNEQLNILDLEKAAEIPESEGGADRGLLNTYKTNLYKDTKDQVYKVVDGVPEGLAVDYPESLAYVQAVDKVLDDKTDLIMARKILIKAYADGKLTADEAKVLNKIKDTAKNIEITKAGGIEKGWLKLTAAFQRLKEHRVNGYSSNKPVEEQAEDLKTFILNAYKEGNDPNDIVDNIIKKRQDLNYPEFVDWEKDKTYDSIIGAVRMIGRDSDGMPIVERLNGR